MKTENTIKNRAKFFSLYYGQNVLYVGGVGHINSSVKIKQFYTNIIKTNH